jgi:hypothetical protein
MGLLLGGLLTGCGLGTTVRFSNPWQAETIRIEFGDNIMQGIGSDVPGWFVAYDESGFWGRFAATEIGRCEPSTQAQWSSDNLRMVPHWYRNALIVDVYDLRQPDQKLGSLRVVPEDSTARQRLSCEGFCCY